MRFIAVLSESESFSFSFFRMATKCLGEDEIEKRDSIRWPGGEDYKQKPAKKGMYIQFYYIVTC
jgi:hypothetical protein